jgi:hypothetical protein
MVSRPVSPATLGVSLSADPVRAAFQRRSIDALSRISMQASTESLTEALAATTDVGTLARVLGDIDVLRAAVTALEPLAPLIARNAEHRLELFSEAGGTLSAVAQCGRDLQRIRQVNRRTASLRAGTAKKSLRSVALHLPNGSVCRRR